jgi:hypothetical protein
MNTAYIFERGILGWESLFGEWKQWPNMAVAWINKSTPHKAQTLTYFCGPILSAFTRPFRSRQFAKLIKTYAGEKIIMVCHSEGAATGLRALKIAGWPRVEELHLICGACDSDFHANGLNAAILAGRIGKVFVYVAGRDAAMRLENTYFGSLCFGLQTAGQPLGLAGPTNVSPIVAGNVEVKQWKNYGHSTCWTRYNFDSTMREIIRT